MLSSQFIHLDLMRDADLRECEMALRVIEEYLTKERSLISTIGDLRGIIVLLSENESNLSRTLRENWRVLEEIKARTIYRRLPSVPLECQSMVRAALTEMKAVVLKVLREAKITQDDYALGSTREA
jgi:hypothetical protein